MPFTKKQIEKYLESPGACPFCGVRRLDALEEPDWIANGEITVEFICWKCKKSWREYYRLTDIEELDSDGSAIPNEEV